MLGSNSFIGKKIYQNLNISKNLNIFTINKYFDEDDIVFLNDRDFYKKYFIDIKKKIDCIINLIHIHKKNYDEEIDININLINKIIYFQNIKNSKIIYFSSVNSTESSGNKYSRSKFLIEKKIIKTNNYQIIRPSTVILEADGHYLGGRKGSSLKIIYFLIRYSFFFPIINNGNFLHTVCFLEDLQKFTYISVTQDLFKNQITNFFSGEYIDYKQFVLFLANKINKKVNFVNIPISFLLFFIKILEFCKIFEINVQMVDNLTSQKIEFDRTQKILKFFNLKKTNWLNDIKKKF